MLTPRDKQAEAYSEGGAGLRGTKPLWTSEIYWFKGVCRPPPLEREKNVNPRTNS